MGSVKMEVKGENDIDLYADDIEQDFAQDEFSGENVDLYDDVIASSTGDHNDNSTSNSNVASEETNGSTYSQQGNNITPNTVGRRHQLYVGNLTWWTTDQDIANAVRDVGVNDFNEVKFFEHRANGQSKGFCVISLGSEQSARVVMDQLPKREIHGQTPVVTPPTKQALSNFESQSKTRPSPSNNSRSQHPGNSNMPPGGPPQNYGGRMGGMNQSMRGGPMSGPMGMSGGPPRMQGPPPGYNGPPHPQSQQQRFQGQPPQWNNGPRPNGPMQGMPGPNMRGPPPPQGPPRPPMYQGPPQQGPPRMPPQQGPPPGGPNWNRPPMQQFPPQMQNMGPRGPPPMGQGPPPQGGPPQGPPAPHVNPAFFPQTGSGPPPGPQMQAHPMQAAPGMPPQGPPHGPPMGPAPVAPHYGPPTGLGGPQPPYGGPPPDHRGDMPALSEQEFEDVMSRNRTVSSSAISRAVSDAAAGEYGSAIETLVTAISLIKQSKVANDDRCKILISSLQDTLRGVEDKSYGSSRRGDRSRSRDRGHGRRSRRERSSSRYRDRSRERDRDRERDRYYADSYRERERERDRSRSRGDRERERDYRDREVEEGARPPRSRNKSPSDAVEPSGEAPNKSRYYDDRYRERERDAGRSRESERERDRDRGREESHRSRH